MSCRSRKPEVERTEVSILSEVEGLKSQKNQKIGSSEKEVDAVFAPDFGDIPLAREDGGHTE